jgi:hypothetical protein
MTEVLNTLDVTWALIQSGLMKHAAAVRPVLGRVLADLEWLTINPTLARKGDLQDSNSNSSMARTQETPFCRAALLERKRMKLGIQT